MRYDAVQFLESLFRPAADVLTVCEPAVGTAPPDVTPADLTGDWYVLWDERAAIMEYDGGMPRELAEHHALLEIRKQMNAAPCRPNRGCL